MKTKIMNWLKNHETICGVALLFASVCTAAFGGAYLGASTSATTNNLVTVNMYGHMNNEVASGETK